MKILVIDIGGTFLKVRATGRRAGVRIASGPSMTPSRMVRLVKQATGKWTYNRVSIGYPGVVRRGRPAVEPKHLGRGWTSFDFSAAFDRPVRIVSDAAMQALGSCKGGRMLFLGLGTGLGSAFILNGMVQPMELAHLPYRNSTYEQHVGTAALRQRGVDRWRRHVIDVATRLQAALEADEVVLGGGNAALLTRVPRHMRLGSNHHAFLGGVRLWASQGRRTAA